MNLRPLLLRAALVAVLLAALFGFSFAVAALNPRGESIATTNSSPSLIVLFPLVALPLVHALLSP